MSTHCRCNPGGPCRCNSNYSRYNPDAGQPAKDEDGFPVVPLVAAIAAGFGVVLIASYAFGKKTSATSSPAGTGPTATQCLAASRTNNKFTGAVAQSGTPRCACVSGWASPGGVQPCVATGSTISGQGGASAPPSSSAPYDPNYGGQPTAAQCRVAQAADSRFTGNVAVSAGPPRCACTGNLASPGGTRPCAVPGTVSSVSPVSYGPPDSTEPVAVDSSSPEGGGGGGPHGPQQSAGLDDDALDMYLR